MNKGKRRTFANMFHPQMDFFQGKCKNFILPQTFSLIYTLFIKIYLITCGPVESTMALCSKLGDLNGIVLITIMLQHVVFAVI